MLTDQTYLVGGQGYCDPNRKDQGHAADLEWLLQTVDKEYDVNKTKLSKGNSTMLPTEQFTKQLRGQTPVLAQIDELPYHNTGGTPLGQLIEEAEAKKATLTQDENGNVSGMGLGLEEAVKAEAFKVFEGNRAQRRRAAVAKKKKAPKHVANTQSKHIKAALGAVILGKLGQVQQDTTDAIKREVLKDMPLSRFAEIASGKVIPEYQKRLMDLQQARAEGSLKPELVSLGEQSAKAVADALYPTLEEKGLTLAPVSGELTEAPIQ
ncbi:hypothetical protein PHABIO_75 [Pseudomonas phage Phabio]|uniref:Uncharacterized protein n=1 Tax=Pseudomonas phage Phabio TaxID=2006668 RepID=A0A1Y0SYH6_9CAUD|nr:hypothetical protein MZD05_gp075 [Pseudomonas phage Phabio]ARV76706.1 hypothetical protein PHABIO_75 [Pseudomonas phage Phabio]